MVVALTAELLAGVRVLDLTNVLAGPYCGYQLALLGAEVIKVEEPKGGDLARQLGADAALNQGLMGASFLAQNAGKKSVTLNLKNGDDVAAFVELVRTADVLIENFRPGVMKRLGLGYEVLRESNERLIYCAISGFGQDGPLSANPAYDQIVQGLAGVMSITGEVSGPPLRVGYPVCDTIGGLFGAFAIGAALFRRSQTGKGEFIDVSMLESTISAMGWAVSNYLIAGISPERMGNDNMTASPSGTFATGDGHINIAANKQEQFEQLCREIGCLDLIEDARFADRESRKRHRVELSNAIEDALVKDTALGWERRLNAKGVPAGRVLSIPEILQHSQIAGREMITTFEDAAGVGKAVSVVRGGFRVGGAAPRPAGPPPRLGEHNGEYLSGPGARRLGRAN